MDYNEASNFIASLHNLSQKFYLKDKTEARLYLKRLQFLLNLLGNPEKKIPHFIHVTGTSGKGSVCLMLNSILRAWGKKTGLLTSPHPSAITERWEINGQEMNKKYFTAITAVIKSKLNKFIKLSPYDLPSFFEICTAMGLYYFAHKKVNWAIIEVGCGGRYDSTNVIPRKDVAVITNVRLDHTDILGNTKAAIAREKVGIIKPKCMVFAMEKDQNIINIIRKECNKQKVGLNNISGARYQTVNANIDYTTFNYHGTNYRLPLLGKHQIGNAILAIEISRSLDIPIKNIKAGLAKAKLPIRMEMISKKPLIILDGAHNPDKIKTTTNTIQQIKQMPGVKIKNTHLLVGFSGNKDIGKIIRQLAGLQPETITCTRYTINPFRKTAEPQIIAKQFKKLLPRAKIKTFIDPREAMDNCKKRMAADDLLLVTGSMFLSGEIRMHFKKNKRQS